MVALIKNSKGEPDKFVLRTCGMPLFLVRTLGAEHALPTTWRADSSVHADTLRSLREQLRGRVLDLPLVEGVGRGPALVELCLQTGAVHVKLALSKPCLLYTSPSPRD